MGQQDILEARQVELQEKIKSIIDTADAEQRGITDEEQTEINGHHAEIRAADDKIATLAAVASTRAEVEARRAAAVPIPPVPVPVVPAYTEARSEPYRKGGTDSYFLDLHSVKYNTEGSTEARTRLQVNSRHYADMERRAGQTTVAGAGGEFAPPWWGVDQFVGLLRAGRVFADRLNNKPLPSGVSSINLPKIATGTATAAQSTQNTAINQQDATTTSVSTGISTIAGGSLVSLQLLQQSPISIDDVILADLAADLAQKIDAAVITNVAGVTGLNGITYTDAAPTSLKIAQQVQAGIDAVSTGIYRPADTIVMRPERWGKLIAAGDANGRPLVLPSTAYGPQNSIGLGNGQTAQGYAGNLRGLDVYIDPNIPVNLGAGTNQDEIFILKADEVFLYESTPQFTTFEQTYANTLSLYCRAHEFYGIIANRYPKAISLITGTGLVSTLAYGS